MSLEIFLPLFLIAGTVLLVAITIWGFRDGRRRGRSGILVAMLVVWSFPIGVLLWWLFRPDVIDASVGREDSDEEIKRRANGGLL